MIIMDFSSFLGEKRWDILESIARSPSSPIELADKLSTTVSYISQQLKLLEVAGLVYKTKTGAAMKGKPRNVYSVSNEFVHLSGVTREVSFKKVIYLTDYHKAMVLIWSLGDVGMHESLSDLYFKIKGMNGISRVLLERITGEVLVVSNSRDIKSKIEAFVRKLSRKVYFEVISEEKIDSKINENHVVIFNGERIDKGGINEK